MPRKGLKPRADGRIDKQVYIGTVDGVKKYKHNYGYAQKEADEKALKVKLSLNKGMKISTTKDTFKEWSDRWLLMQELIQQGKPTAKKNMDNYRRCVKKYESIFNYPVTKITASDIKRIIIQNAIKNESNGLPASKRTLQDVKSVAVRIFNMMIEERITDFNPASFVKIEELPVLAEKEERRALTEEEQGWILNTDHRAKTAAMICMYAGPRRGELIPLQWSDIDLDAGTISINKAVAMINGKSFIKDFGKTDYAMRTIYMPDILIDYLKCQPKTSLYVCPSVEGTLLNDIGWRRMWDSYLADINIKHGDFSDFLNKPKSKFDPNGVPFVIPRFTAHWLRHTFATFLYLSGVDVMTAKEQMGHSDIKTTMNIYTHLDEKYKKRKMDKMNLFIKNARQIHVKEA